MPRHSSVKRDLDSMSPRLTPVHEVQVCSYRCIVSHESQLLEDFSLCILQKHNCLGKSAEIPALPDPPPMSSFRGEDLSHELAESLFIGWLGTPANIRAASSAMLPNTVATEDRAWVMTFCKVILTCTIGMAA